jgi:hypothetical protein
MRYATIDGEQVQSSSELGVDATNILDSLPVATLLFDMAHSPPKLVYANELAMKTLERDAPTQELRRMEIVQLTDYVRAKQGEESAPEAVRGYQMSLRKLTRRGPKNLMALYMEPLVQRVSSLKLRPSQRMTRRPSPAQIYTNPTVPALIRVAVR